MKGILGRKIGMTQVFSREGKLIPVTVVEVEPNYVSQIKTMETDGYEAIQLAAISKKEKNTTKPEMGHLKKAGVEPKRFLKEIRGVNVSEYTLGQKVDASIFTEGEMVDVSGISKGKGYQGVIKRYNQTRGPMGHGSQYHRGVGSMGTLLPMHVLKGKKLPGHMGHELVTVQNLEIVKIDLENNIVLIKGNVPGPKKALVVIKTAVKNPDKVNEKVDLVFYEVEEVTNDVENSEVVENDTLEETVETTEEVETSETKEEEPTGE
ncbi:MAG: 50S ribosomal protein L3 [Bacilli bacterium]|nr:50S ribosomal protein L3 [Bacilli bacterium]